jgi:hypothetical protein
MQSMRRSAMLCSTALLLVAACGKSEQAADTTKAAAAAPAPAPAPAVTLADFAGKWAVVATPESGKDTSVTKYTLTATADTSGWVIDFPSGLKVPVHVMLSGDSVSVSTGQFSSQRRKSMKVSSEGWSRLQNGKMVGETTAHYKTAGADSVLKLRVEGTKMP